MFTALLLHGVIAAISFLDHEEGQNLAEYAVMLGLVALAVIAVLFVFGDTITQIFTDFLAAFPGGGS